MERISRVTLSYSGEASRAAKIFRPTPPDPPRTRARSPFLRRDPGAGAFLEEGSVRGEGNAGGG